MQPIPFECAKIYVFIEVEVLSLHQRVTLGPSRVDGPAWKRGDEVALLYYAIDWNDFRIWKPLPSRAAEVKHIEIVIIRLHGLEPMDIYEWLRVDSKVRRELEENAHFRHMEACEHI